MAGSELWDCTGNDEWFFRGNKLMLSSGMKKHLRELCGYTPPEIPFYVYQMNKSNVKRKGRMVSSNHSYFDFSDYLLPIIWEL